MTRSDLLLATHKAYNFLDKISANHETKACETTGLISSMNNKIENAYDLVFELEKDPVFKELGERLRKGLESNTLIQ